MHIEPLESCIAQAVIAAANGLSVTFTEMGAVKIGGDLRGGSADGNIFTEIDRSGYIEAFRIASIFIGGSIIAGDNSDTGDLTKCASIRALRDIGSVTVKGSIIGHRGSQGDSLVYITARGQETPGSTSDVAIKSLKIGGSVEHARILGGYSVALQPINGNASIGPVSVGGDWVASDLTAGVRDDATTMLDNYFGDGDDQLIGSDTDALIARISSITIKGTVVGTGASGDHFGFVAQQIGKFKSLGFTATLTSGTDAPIELSIVTGDVTVREV
jgi:hypothetical protein